jgi:hypothetical protein
MSRRLAAGIVLFAAVAFARDAAALADYLSTRSRPAAQDPQPGDPSENVCYRNRRVEFDSGGTIVFTSATLPTLDEEAAIYTAIAAWNAALGTSVRLEYGGVEDNVDFLGLANGAGPCPTVCEELTSNSINTIELNASGGSCPLTDASETILANPGFQGAWQVHSYCGTDYWSIRGSRIRVAPGITGAGLVRVLAHEIGMALGFAPNSACTPQNPCVLDPDIDLSAGSPPYSVSLGSYDLEALAAVYPGWDISAPASACGLSTGNTATITNPQAGTTYTWTALDGASITSGQGTASIAFSVPAFSGYVFCFLPPCPQQAVRLTVTASRGCSGPGTSPTYAATGYASIGVVPGDYEVAPYTANVSSSGGTESIQVTATKSCGGWTATAPQGGFVTITSGATGTGNGAAQYSVAANPAAYARTSVLTVAGQPVEITQSGAGSGTFSLTATASSSQVVLSWSPIAGAVSYSVSRKSAGGPFMTIASNVNGLAATDPNVYETGYLYRVSAYNGIGYIAHSNVDLAVVKEYSAPNLSAGSVVRAEDFAQVQEAIDYARAVVDWPEAPFTQIVPGTPILRSHLIQLRTEADRVRGTVGLSGFPYTDPSVTAGLTRAKAAHILNLRDALR